MGEHAFLSASSAEKWLNCIPSARLESTFDDESSESAQEGTLAHSLAELKSRKYFTKMTKKAYTTEYNKLKKDGLFTKDMDNYTDEYLEYLKDIAFKTDIPPHIGFETKIDYSDIAPKGFGTVDCFMIRNGVLHIIDFKYGKTIPVSSKNNPQLKLYALGVLKKYSALFSITDIILHIVQPRIKNTSKWEIAADDLYSWAETVKPIAKLAFDGTGEHKVGPWCDSHFCKGRPLCRVYMEQMKAVKPFIEKQPDTLTNEEVGQALTLAADIKKWYSLLESFTQKTILSGETIPGWKVVEGRSNRAFDNIDQAFKVLINSGIDEAVLYKRQPITLTECEKIMGKKDFEGILKEHITKPQGKPTVVPESDTREPFNPALNDFKDIVTQ
ncbi:MAG: DUF2800 domain-containing protein [Anaerotignaceae bacterium]